MTEAAREATEATSTLQAALRMTAVSLKLATTARERADAAASAAAQLAAELSRAADAAQQSANAAANAAKAVETARDRTKSAADAAAKDAVDLCPRRGRRPARRNRCPRRSDHGGSRPRHGQGNHPRRSARGRTRHLAGAGRVAAGERGKARERRRSSPSQHAQDRKRERHQGSGAPRRRRADVDQNCVRRRRCRDGRGRTRGEAKVPADAASQASAKAAPSISRPRATPRPRSRRCRPPPRASRNPKRFRRSRPPMSPPSPTSSARAKRPRSCSAAAPIRSASRPRPNPRSRCHGVDDQCAVAAARSGCRRPRNPRVPSPRSSRCPCLRRGLRRCADKATPQRLILGAPERRHRDFFRGCARRIAHADRFEEARQQAVQPAPNLPHFTPAPSVAARGMGVFMPTVQVQIPALAQSQSDRQHRACGAAGRTDLLVRGAPADRSGLGAAYARGPQPGRPRADLGAAGRVRPARLPAHRTRHLSRAVRDRPRRDACRARRAERARRRQRIATAVRRAPAATHQPTSLRRFAARSSCVARAKPKRRNGDRQQRHRPADDGRHSRSRGLAGAGGEPPAGGSPGQRADLRAADAGGRGARLPADLLVGRARRPADAPRVPRDRRGPRQAAHRQRAAAGAGEPAGGRGSPASPGAEDGGDRPAQRRHRPRLQQHARRDLGKPRPDAPAHRRGRLQHRALHERSGRGGQALRLADAPPAGLRAAAAARAAAGGRQPDDLHHVGPAALDARRADPHRDRERRRPVADPRRSAPARERDPQYRHQRAATRCRTAAG